MAEQQKRDNSLDFLRGLAAISIIFIHTCFWSGEAYVPVWVKSLSLVVDVPFFFFLSGWGFSYVRSLGGSIGSLLNIYKKYVIFILNYVGILYLIGHFTAEYPGFNLPNFYANLFFLQGEMTALPVVMGSIWFLPVYFAVAATGSLVLSRLWRNVAGDEKLYQQSCLIFLFIIVMGLLYSFLGCNFFYLSKQFLFYLFFYLLGAVCRNVRINSFFWALALIILDLAVIKILGEYLGLEYQVMQDMKFPPNIIYLLYSLLFIILALWLKTKLSNITSNNVLCRVGRLAILFYFCQGISSSLLYFHLPEIEVGWLLKLLIAFGYNMALCFILVIILHKICKLEKVLENMLKQLFRIFFMSNN